MIRKENLEEIIYGILFVAGDGVDVSFIAEKLDEDIKVVKKAIDKLEEKLSGESGVHLIKFNNKIQLASNPKYAESISAVLNPIREKALTKATLETLSIVAYKQPITRLEVEEVRGVNSDYTIQYLIDNKMIEVVGKKDAVGKPLLFGTTDEFLKRFGLESLRGLPSYEELLDRIKTIYAESPIELFDKVEIEDRDGIVYDLNEEEQETIKIEEIDEKIKKAVENINFKLPVEEIPDFLKDEEDIVRVD